MKHIVFIYHRLSTNTGAASSTQSFEVNSLEAAKEAEKRIRNNAPSYSYEDLKCIIIPKGHATKEEILLSLNAANPMASPEELDARADAFLRIIKDSQV